MKKILVPFDFSTPSREAFSLALNIAVKNKSQITLLHVLVPPPVYGAGSAGEPLAFDPIIFERIEEEANNELKKIKDIATAKSVKADTEVVYGELRSCVTNLIETKKIDLVIMGTSGTSGLSEVFIGSNTEKIVRFSPVPVLAVHKSFALKSIKNILVPSTLQLNETRFMKSLKELQDFFDATLHILVVNTPVHFRTAAEGNEALQEFVKYYKLKNFKTHFRNYKREEDGIIDFARSEKMDLIAMATHARKGLAHVFNISVTEDVVNHTQSPVWTYGLKSNQPL